MALPFAFTSGADLLSMGAASGKSFAEMMLDNELVHRSPEQVEAGLDQIAAAMDASSTRSGSIRRRTASAIWRKNSP